MALIDWSDSEEMIGLLIEYVADERREAQHDPERRRFLAQLLRSLESLDDRASAESLQRVRDSLSEAFANDPVVEHIEACIGELGRIADHDHRV